MEKAIKLIITEEATEFSQESNAAMENYNITPAFCSKDGEETPFRESRIYKILSKFFHVTHELHEQHFMFKENGHWHITPLFFALIIIETMDVIFAF